MVARFLIATKTTNPADGRQLIVEYNANQFANNEVELQIQKRPVYSPRGYRIGTRETWRLQGFLHGTDQDDVGSEINKREGWFKVQGGDLKLLYDDGTTVSAHKLLNADCIGEIRVTSVNFPKGDGAEYSTFRTWTATVEGVKNQIENSLLAFQESITYSGGGPRFVHLQTMTGLPQKQQTAAATPYQTVQAGSALGFEAYPLPPGPIWPAAEKRDLRQITRRGPRRDRDDFVEFGIDWQYIHESAVDLIGLPNAL